MSVFVRASIRAGVTTLVVCALALALLSNHSARFDPGKPGPGTATEGNGPTAAVGPTAPVRFTAAVGSEECVIPIHEEDWHGASCDPSSGRRGSDVRWTSQ